MKADVDFIQRIAHGVLKLALINKITMYFSAKISPLMLKAGYYESPMLFVAKRVTIAILVFIIGAIISVVGKVFLNYDIILPILASLMFSLTILFSMFLQTYMMIKDRKNRLNKELPYFILYASILQNAGITLYSSLAKLVKENLFKNVKKEAMVFLRDIKLLGKDPLTALDKLAANCPLKEFQDIIYGYTSLFKSGGDISRYLEEKSKELLSELRFKWKMYAERSIDLGESIAAIFLIFTLLILIGSIILPTDAILIVNFLNFILIPGAAIFSITIIDSLIPEINTKIFIPKKLVATILSISIASGFFLYIFFPTLEISYIILLTLMILTFGNGVIYWRKNKELKAIEDAIPKFLRDLTEFRKMGFTPAQAIMRISWMKKYNKHFDKILNSIASHIKMGLDLRKFPKMGSWLLNYVIFILGEIENSGGGTPALLEELTRFVSEVQRMRSEARRTLMLYEIIAYMTPILLTLSLALILKLSSTLIISTMSEAISMFGIGINTGFGEIFNMFKISIIEASLTFALLTSKIIDFSIKNTLRGFFILVITAMSFMVTPYIAEYVVSLLF